MKIQERINEIINEVEINEEELNKSLKEKFKEWLLRSIETKKGLIHLLTLQDIELKETKENNKYLRKEKKKYKDLYIELDKKCKEFEISNNQLLLEVEELNKKLSKK